MAFFLHFGLDWTIEPKPEEITLPKLEQKYFRQFSRQCNEQKKLGDKI